MGKLLTKKQKSLSNMVKVNYWIVFFPRISQDKKNVQSIDRVLFSRRRGGSGVGLRPRSGRTGQTQQQGSSCVRPEQWAGEEGIPAHSSSAHAPPRQESRQCRPMILTKVSGTAVASDLICHWVYVLGYKVNQLS